MQVAQNLYENGYITYMRTDSTNLAQVAVDAARDLVSSQYGVEYLPDGRGPTNPRSRTPRRLTKRFVRPDIRSDSLNRCERSWITTSSGCSR